MRKIHDETSSDSDTNVCFIESDEDADGDDAYSI